MALDLRVTDEFDVLPRFGGLHDLLAADSSTGQCELVAGSALPASAWHAGSIGDMAGHPVPEWWNSDPPIVCKPVRLFRVRNAVYAPAFGAVIGSDGAVMKHTVGQARYITPDLSGLPHAAKEGEHIVFRPPDDLPLLPAGIVSMPWGAIYNYGHFVCDCLTSVASLFELSRTGYPCVFPPLKPWQRRHIELLGAPSAELDQPLYRVSDVLFTSGMWQFLNAPNINYRMVRDIQLRNKRVTDVRFDKVYVTRSPVTQANSDRRRFLSEAALEERLRTLGFAIIAPEFFDIDEQIDLFRNAELVVSCRGAALANVIYCRPDTTIVEVIPVIDGFEGYTWVRDICAIVGCRWRPYFCAGVPPENPVVSFGVKRPNAAFSFDVDVADLIAFIQRSC